MMDLTQEQVDKAREIIAKAFGDVYADWIGARSDESLKADETTGLSVFDELTRRAGFSAPEHS